ncbi:hypothetical protein OGAPHI_007162 [Ogataea philodendri]|uniref:Uncharacterized protein n=1 Tax=Ogataea philodendri TaxID=1378263 RepID=A0A9P8T0G3_9ASCO|nr:uncharacterized protein OGAPHI_007162 [Ogataea philodendri]KAH3660576.1 hypothetical protein OGAPHI_007162 [Ogataea philodendri]
MILTPIKTVMIAAPAESPLSRLNGWSVNDVVCDPAAPSPVDEPPFVAVYGAVRTARQQHACVIGPLVFGDGGAIVVDVGTVVCEIVRVRLVHKLDSNKPVVHFLGPVDVRVVSCESGQTGTDMEQSSVRDRVLVVVTRVPRENLPSKASVTTVSVPSPGHGVENGLCQIQPLWLVVRRVGEVPLGGLDCSNSPERLIVISFSGGLIQRNVVVVFSNLVQQRLFDGFLISVVFQKVPVIDHGAPGSSSLPPIVRIGKHANRSALLISPVVAHVLVLRSIRVGGDMSGGLVRAGNLVDLSSDRIAGTGVGHTLGNGVGHTLGNRVGNTLRLVNLLILIAQKIDRILRELERAVPATIKIDALTKSATVTRDITISAMVYDIVSLIALMEGLYLDCSVSPSRDPHKNNLLFF